MIQMNLESRKRLTEWAYGCSCEGIFREFVMDMYTLLFIKWIAKTYYIAHETVLFFVAAWMGEGIGGSMDTCICIAGFLHCSSETIITLLMCYTPIQNKKFIMKKNNVHILNFLVAKHTVLGNQSTSIFKKQVSCWR